MLPGGWFTRAVEVWSVAWWLVRWGCRGVECCLVVVSPRAVEVWGVTWWFLLISAVEFTSAVEVWSVGLFTCAVEVWSVAW